MGAAQVSINRWVDKTTLGHLHIGILLSHKKEENFTLCNSTDGPGEHYANKISQSEKDTYCMISLICGIEWTHRTNKQNRDRLIDWEQMESSRRGVVSGWRDWAKRKKDSWAWRTMCWLQVGEGIRGLNGSGKNTVKFFKNKMIIHPTCLGYYWSSVVQEWASVVPISLLNMCILDDEFLDHSHHSRS